ncbi:hypothetical protein OF83DRAFT_1141387 [Amylostereum chailletii]|nr:hypothetical protein OF83DRAFT_1141387 [Amylostereum chailletii]
MCESLPPPSWALPATSAVRRPPVPSLPYHACTPYTYATMHLSPMLVAPCANRPNM